MVPVEEQFEPAHVSVLHRLHDLLVLHVARFRNGILLEQEKVTKMFVAAPGTYRRRVNLYSATPTTRWLPQDRYPRKATRPSRKAGSRAAYRRAGPRPRCS